MPVVKKLRYFIRLLGAIIRKQYLLILGSCVLGAVFFFFLPKILAILPKAVPSEKIGIVGQFTVSDLPNEVLGDLSFGLTEINQKGEVVPKIANKILVSEDGLTYTAVLNGQSLVWHDGKELAPQDINYNFKDVSISINDNKLIFTLKEPFAPFPSFLSKPLFKKGLIGLGDYKIKRVANKGKNIGSLYLVPFKNKSLPGKIYRFYNSESELINAYNLGEINILKNISNISDLFLGPKSNIKEVNPEDIYLALFFNTNKAPFSEKTFRQALAYAIPKEKGSLRATGPINPFSWAYNPDVKPYNFDTAHAKSLLNSEEVNYEDLKIVISTMPQYENIASSIRDFWKNIGIESEVKVQMYVPEDFDVLLAARKIPQDPDQYYFWHSTQEGNISHFKSPRIDKLLEDGRKTTDNEQRKSVYFDFQRFLVEESPAIFLSHPTYYNISRN